MCSLILVLSLPGCGSQKTAAKKTAPAKIERPNEGDIYKVVLTPKAEQRLQISTVPVEQRPMPRTRTVGGEVTIADGASVIVTAPLTGTLLKPDTAESPKAGSTVTSGGVVFHLLPLLSPEREVPTAAERVSMANAQASLVSARIIADGDVKQSEARVEAANIALDRAKRLFADKAGAARAVDDAQAQLDITMKGLEAARARKELLDKVTLEAVAGKVTSVAVRAPHAGVLRNVSSSIGQTVTLGSPLFEVVDMKTLWVRVPIYPGLRQQLVGGGNAIIRRLGDNDEQLTVKPVAAPPSADSIASTIDLFFEVPNEAGGFHPGERVEVTLPIAGEAESRVIPRAAVIRDIHGIGWVYVNTATHTFERRRVEVAFTTKDHSVLSQGPPVGTKVVVDGAAELFGTEFGAGK